eukprot:CAMPEP_0167757670 /NCGR_PEP_ID=MMETSP0110_2-20121227/10052_1 /TAXON_ID=629695 /ORGANISM="Gymnochlora sp., Strain CCMP2014" /LENGTH=309 /DNA_ID=CAMNT_0007643881 /DNA_START=272 /DNA_END=1202 /DNA_ORIENTATION=+
MYLPPDCDEVIGDISEPFIGVCSNKWKNVKPFIRPTQHDVGYAWVQRKLENDFDSKKHAQDEISSTTIPVVIGPNNVTGGYAYYVVDKHHTLSALDYSGYDETHVLLTVICDSRDEHYSDFLDLLSHYNLDYLGTHPSRDQQSEKIFPTQLPLTFELNSGKMVFRDDPWRALAGYSRKIKSENCSDYKYCMRCFVRGCTDEGTSVPFVEFEWGYFFVEALSNQSLWPSKEDFDRFTTLYKSLPHNDIGDIDTDLWTDTAKALVPLCRGNSAGEYHIPSSLFPRTTLPGYTRGNTQLPADPECQAPTCPF